MYIRSTRTDLPHDHAEQVTYGFQVWGIGLQFTLLINILVGEFERASVPRVFQNFIQKQSKICKVHMDGFCPSCMWVRVELVHVSAAQHTTVRH